MRTSKSFRISNEDYVLGHWDVAVATEILAWLVSTMGPSVKPAFMSLAGNSNIMDIQLADIDMKVGIEVLDILLKNLAGLVKPEEYARRMEQIFASDVLCNGRPVDFRQHFRGRQKDMHRVALEILKYQYSDFLEGVLSTSAGLGQQTDRSLHSTQAN